MNTAYQKAVKIKIGFGAVLGIAAFFLFLNPVAHAQTPQCTNSYVQVSVHNAAGSIVSNINWSFNIQDRDADSKPVFGRGLVGGRTDEKGLINITFNPTGNLNNVGEYMYALKIYESNPDAGALIDWNYQVNCGSSVTRDVRLSRLKFVVRNVSGESLKEYRWQLYTQKLDIDGKPITDKTVSLDLSTETAGVKYVYIAPGTYLVRIPASGTLYYQVDSIAISAGRDTSVARTLSSIRVIARNETGERASGARVEVWSQKYDLSNKPVADVLITSVTIGNTGFADIFLPSSLYAIKVTDWSYDVKVSANSVTEVRLKQSTPGASDANQTPTITIISISEPRTTPSRPDDTLFQVKGFARVYVLKNGLKHYIPSRLIFNAYGYQWGSIIFISKSEADSYTEGPALTLPSYLALKDGDLVKTATNPAVFLIQSGSKRLFTSAEAFESAGYSWKNIIVVSDSVLKDRPDGDPITVQKITDDSLVKTASDPTVYRIGGTGRRPFASGRVFLTSGLRWKDIKTITADDLAKYTLGDQITFEADDTDQDGLTSVEEKKYGTDPTKDDSDSDGYLDGEEVYNGYNPLGQGTLVTP